MKSNSYLTAPKPLNLISSLRSISFSDILFITSLVAVLFGINEFAIVFCLFILLKHFNTIRLPKNILVFLGTTFIAGLFSTILFIYLSPTIISAADTSILNLRLRYFFIRIMYAIFATIYFSEKDFRQLMALVINISALGSTLALYQIFSSILPGNGFERITMFSSEPSSAAMLYAFFAPLLILGKNKNVINSKIVPLFILIGIFILSKALIFVYLFWGILWMKSLEYKILSYILIAVSGILLLPLLVKIKPVADMIKYFTVLSDYGIYGLNNSNQIWTSFQFRTTGLLTSLSYFAENPFGIGFGVFHLKYVDTMATSHIMENMDGREINEVLAGTRFASPKAALLELIVSSGVFFLVPFVFESVKYLRKNIHKLLKISLLSLILASTMIEIAPFLMYLCLILVFGNKYMEMEW